MIKLEKKNNAVPSGKIIFEIISVDYTLLPQPERMYTKRSIDIIFFSYSKYLILLKIHHKQTIKKVPQQTFKPYKQSRRDLDQNKSSFRRNCCKYRRLTIKCRC